VRAGQLLHLLDDCGRPANVCNELARRLGMTLTQMQRAAVDLEAAGAVRLVHSWAGLLVCRLRKTP
jgi:hypothetical protein